MSVWLFLVFSFLVINRGIQTTHLINIILVAGIIYYSDCISNKCYNNCMISFISVLFTLYWTWFISVPEVNNIGFRSLCICLQGQLWLINWFAKGQVDSDYWSWYNFVLYTKYTLTHRKHWNRHFLNLLWFFVYNHKFAQNILSVAVLPCTYFLCQLCQGFLTLSWYTYMYMLILNIINIKTN